MDAVFWCEVGAAALAAGVVVATRGRRKAPPLSTATGAAYDGPTRVLIVDDEPSFTRLMRRVLAEHGLAVDIAPTCAQARALVHQYPYALVIVDRLLPDGDGARLLDEIRTRTMVYSGTDAAGLDTLRAAKVADCVLPKGSDLDELERTVLALLRGRTP